MKKVNYILKSLLLAGCMFILCNSTIAQVPQGMNYQAIARDAAGSPLLNQHICLQMTIHTGSAGPIVYQENDSVTTNGFGLFTIKIGMGVVQQGTFNTIQWSTGNQYMQAAMDLTGNCTGFVDMGESQLLTVPYAMYAGSGANGPTGATGPTGSQGNPGTNGTNGTNGATGPQGNPGTNGTNGTNGATGPQGNPGTNGTNGTNGATGPQGTNGTNGTNGVTGATGSSGANGDRYTTTSSNTMTISVITQNFTVGTDLSYSIGQTVIISNSANNLMTGTVTAYNSISGAMTVSITSITGSGTFSTWDVSLNGAAGPAGPTGPQGVAGPAGSQGPQGVAGSTGAQGPQGVAGSTGAQGPQGVAGSTGAQGPQGVAGSTGAQGPQGVAGSTGAQGPQGVAGSTGAQGPQGVAGSTGAQGPQGVAGSTGAQGPQGVAGSTGAQGPQGVAGSTGAQGPQGADGATGATGAANINGTTNYVVKFTAPTTGGNSLIFDNGTNVGIGTTSPAQQLHVYSNSSTTFVDNFGYADHAAIIGDNESNDNTNESEGIYGYAGSNLLANYGVFGGCGSSGTSNVGVLGISAAATTGVNCAVFGLSYGTSNNDWAGYFTGRGYFSGNVGIGTTSPAVQLHVVSSSSTTFLNNLGYQQHATIIGDNESNDINYQSDGVYGYAGSNLIENNGVFGGCGSSAYNNAAVIGISAAATNGNNYAVYGFTFGNSNNDWAGYFEGRGYFTGNVGIGTETPINQLDVAGGVALGSYAGVNSASANGMIIPGAVGIGTPAPQYILDVAGRIRLRQDPSSNNTTNTAGLWLYQTTPHTDQAFMGMNDDNDMGWFGTGLGNFGLLMNTTSGNVGINNTAPVSKLQVSNGAVLFDGTAGSTPVSGQGNRMMWVPAKAAFRVGTADGSEWDDANIGTYSIAMGEGNTAAGEWSVALGRLNSASGQNSTAMGYDATASALNSVAIGSEVYASGNNSTALGNNVSTYGYGGSFMIGDNSTLTFLNCNFANKFRARFDNGYDLFTSSDLSTGVYMGNGANSWSSISDSTKKANFKAVEGEDILNKIGRMRACSWNYKSQDPKEFRHYGPMAQDFFASFGNDGIGRCGNDTTIATSDMEGISFIAIQALKKRTDELKIALLELQNTKADMQTIKASNEAMKEELNSLKDLLKQQGIIKDSGTISAAK